jgi:hypothetical protein
MTDPDWRRPESSELFPEDVLGAEDLAVATLSVDADSELAGELLLDPLPILAENIEGVGTDWSVSVHRVNAERGVGLMSGPRKLVLLLLLIPSREHVAAFAYRISEKGA